MQDNSFMLSWVEDHGFHGGAEETSQHFIKSSPYKIVYNDFRDSVDWFVLNNLRDIYVLFPQFINYIIEKKNYIYFPRDILGINYADRIKDLCERAKLVIFLSPLHYIKFTEMYGLTIKNYGIIPPYVEIKRNKKIKKNKLLVYFGKMYNHKGIDSMLLWAKKYHHTIDFYGDGDPIAIERIKQSKYGNYKGFVKKENVSNILDQYKFYVCLPEEFEAFGRSTAQAYLCDCQILHNNKIGFMSYEWNYSNKQEVKKKLINSKDEFWKKLQQVIFSNN